MELISSEERELLCRVRCWDEKDLQRLTDTFGLSPQGVWPSDERFRELLKLQSAGIVQEDCPSEHYWNFRVLDHSKLPEWLQALIRENVESEVEKARASEKL